MATTYTSFLGLALPVTGELSGTWGDTVNNYITSYLDASIAGTLTLTASTTLTKTTNAALGSTSSQYSVLLCSPTVANITITVPAQSKIYTVINTSPTYTVTIRGATPTTGVTLAVSETAIVAWNGTDFIRISSGNSTTGNLTVNGNLTVTGNTTLGNASGDTVTVTGTIASNLIFTDNTYDIGASAATRPRTGYFGTSVITPFVSSAASSDLLLKSAGTTAITIDTSQEVGIGTSTPAYLLDVAGTTSAYGLLTTSIGTPATPTAVGSTSGGSLAANNWYFKIVAVDGLGGVTLPSTESTVVATTGATSSIVVSWTATTAAKSYQVWYSNTTGTQANYFAATTNSYTLTTTTGNTAGTIPAANTTGRVTVNAAGGISTNQTTFPIANTATTIQLSNTATTAVTASIATAAVAGSTLTFGGGITTGTHTIKMGTGSGGTALFDAGNVASIGSLFTTPTTGAINIATANTTGAITIGATGTRNFTVGGGPASANTINLFNSTNTANQTMNLLSGSGNFTKAFNFGTGATVAAGQVTVTVGGNNTTGTNTITIGSASGGTATFDTTGAAGTGRLFPTVTTGAINIAAGQTTGNLAVMGVQSSGTFTLGGATSTGSITIGQSTGAQTLNLATGATLAATTKAVNIATNGVATSTTNVTIGGTTGDGTISIGPSSGTQTLELLAGVTLSGTTKTINIGTAGNYPYTQGIVNVTIGSSGSDAGSAVNLYSNTTSIASDLSWQPRTPVQGYKYITFTNSPTSVGFGTYGSLGFLFRANYNNYSSSDVTDVAILTFSNNATGGAASVLGRSVISLANTVSNYPGGSYGFRTALDLDMGSTSSYIGTFYGGTAGTPPAGVANRAQMVFLGYGAGGYTDNGGIGFDLSPESNSTNIGAFAGSGYNNATTGAYPSFTTLGSYATNIGAKAGRITINAYAVNLPANITVGSYQLNLGVEAGTISTTGGVSIGSSTINIGYLAGYATANDNCSITTGIYNIAIGAGAGSIQATTGSYSVGNYNLFIGDDAGSIANKSLGSNNVFIGASTGQSAVTGCTGALVLGSDTGFTVDSGNIIIGSTNAGNLFYASGTAGAQFSTLQLNNNSALTLRSTGGLTFYDNEFTLVDQTDTTKKAKFELSGLTTATTFTYTLPTLTGTLATIGNLTQSFAGATTIANAFTVTGTSTSTSIQSTQSTGTITIGGTAGTGAITVGQSTGVQTLNLGTGATTAATTKTINIGTAGVSTSVTNINIGSAVVGATGTITMSLPTVLPAGTAALSPLKMTSGTVNTTPVAGVVEYDGNVFYATADTTSGRGLWPTIQYFRLTADVTAFGPAIANFFGGTSGVTLDTSGFYEVEYNVYFTKTTAGTVTFTLTYANAPINCDANYVGTPVGGVGTVGAPQTAALAKSTATLSALPVTGSLTTAVNHQYVVKAMFQANATTGGTLNLQVTSSAGTVTPLTGSYYKITRLPAANAGAFV